MKSTPAQQRIATVLLAEAWAADEAGERAQATRLVRRYLRIVGRPKVGCLPVRAVVCRTDASIRFEGIAAAARTLRVRSCNSVRSAIACGGTVGGMHLRYEDTPEDECPQMQRKQVPVKWHGLEYASITEAAAATLPPGMGWHTWQERVRRHAKRLPVKNEAPT